MTLKAFRSLCLTLCLSLAAAAVSAAPFTSPRGGCKLNVPAGWHVQPHGAAGEDTRIVVNQKAAVGERTASPFLIIHSHLVDSGVTSEGLTKFNQTILSDFREHLPDLKVLSQNLSTLDGVRALDCVFTAPATGDLLRFHEVLVLRHNIASTFICICPEQVHSQYDPIFAQMLASIRWRSL